MSVMRLDLLAAIALSGCAANEGATSVLASEPIPLVGETLFQADATACHVGLPGHYLGCEAFSAPLVPPAITKAPEGLIEQTDMNYTYEMTFKCFSAATLVATLEVDGKEYKVPSSIAGTPQNVSFTVKVSSNALGVIRIPAHSASIDTGCRLAVLSKVALPDLAFLSGVVAYVGPKLKSYTNTYATLATDASIGDVQLAATKALAVADKRLSGLLDQWVQESTTPDPAPARLRSYCKNIRDVWEVAGELDSSGQPALLDEVPPSLQVALTANCLTLDGAVMEGQLRTAITTLTTTGCQPNGGPCPARTQVLSDLEAGRQALSRDLTDMVSYIDAERDRLGLLYGAIKAAADEILTAVDSWLKTHD